MKIFEIIYKSGHQQWVVAHTNTEALHTVLCTETVDLDDMQEIKEFPENRWDEIITANRNADHIDSELRYDTTFREALSCCCSEQIIAATFYED